MDFETLLAAWEGEHAVVRHDAESGAWMFVCVHSTVLGPSLGGVLYECLLCSCELV